MLYRIQRQIHKLVFFFEICHRSTDGDFGRKLLLIGFQALCPEVSFSLHLYGNNLFACIHDEINFAGPSVIGVVVNAQILNGLQLLANILLRKGTFEFNKEVVSVQQGTLAEACHTPKQSHINKEQLECL